jgi:tripartite-type tricarboxylate transporter receptor subunit TctC
LLFLATAHVILPALQKTPYDWEKDFAPVFGVTSSPLVFAVNASSGIRSLKDLAAAGNAAKGGISYGSGGAGSISHLAEVRLLEELKTKGTHIPFRGFNLAVEALLGEQIQLVCATSIELGEMARAGKVRILAVTSEKRMPLLPDVPTAGEQGLPDFTAASWNAIMGPAGLPEDIANRLNAAFATAAKDPEVRDRLYKLGVTWIPKSRPELAQFQREESARWKRVIQENGIKLTA